LTHQRGTPLNVLYHRQLAALMKHDPGVRLRTRVVRSFGLDHVSRLNRLLVGPRIDGVMVHLREAAIVAAARAVVRESSDDQTRRRIHPSMFRRGHRPAAAGPSFGGIFPAADEARGPDAYAESDDDLQDLPLPGRRVAGFRLRNLNVMLGVMAGLGGWAIEEELLRFDELAGACRERGIPLFALGPTPAAYSYWADRVMRQANARIRRHLAGMDVSYALMEQRRDRAGHSLTRADGFHLSLEGHGFVAEQLHEQGMRDWVARILEARESVVVLG
jgi:hypothetical protein